MRLNMLLFFMYLLVCNIVYQIIDMAKHKTGDELRKRQQQLKTKIKPRLDLLIGSVVSYHMKCGKKNCKCVLGEQHVCFYLSLKKQGKTVNSYLPKNLVERA